MNQHDYIQRLEHIAKVASMLPCKCKKHAHLGKCIACFAKETRDLNQDGLAAAPAIVRWAMTPDVPSDGFQGILCPLVEEMEREGKKTLKEALASEEPTSCKGSDPLQAALDGG